MSAAKMDVLASAAAAAMAVAKVLMMAPPHPDAAV
jgi:hypothetical protein